MKTQLSNGNKLIANEKNTENCKQSQKKKFQRNRKKQY